MVAPLGLQQSDGVPVPQCSCGYAKKFGCFTYGEFVHAHYCDA
ncbi:hypothetical protein CPTD_00518 [Corynebacterium pseudotuberculosis]|nr:Hypothetical protein BFF96_0506 [Corynebacterium pseudotuberculosis]AUY59894.1 Hypothetical protein BFG00_0506 [Corynebacterium pseudotuberculosis]KEX88780.1 hypothetical protein CPTD_00518 [Corynebacterium pseudotuberculosis]